MPDTTLLPDPQMLKPPVIHNVSSAKDPVEFISAFKDDSQLPQEGFGLSLSGGGYRSMLFHLGVLWRLNEFRMLPQLNRISSVSGGSITAVFLALKWNRFNWDNGMAADFQRTIVDPICSLADHTIDIASIVTGILNPCQSICDRLSKAYQEHLFGDATLHDLPDDTKEKPTFIINASNVQTGALFRFTRRYIADYRVGCIENPKLLLATAVTASSAFPPVLSPMILKLPKGLMQPLQGADLHREPYTSRIFLTDGGVYDNLGLETVWKRCAKVIVSDGGGQMSGEESPARNWLQHALRINGLIDNQVRALRKRQVVESLMSKDRQGTYFRMRGDISDYSVEGSLPCPFERTYRLALTPTRLARIKRERQHNIINWGYALCDAAVRKWIDASLPPPERFPLPGGV